MPLAVVGSPVVPAAGKSATMSVVATKAAAAAATAGTAEPSRTIPDGDLGSTSPVAKSLTLRRTLRTPSENC